MVLARAGSAASESGCGYYLLGDIDHSHSVGKRCDRNIPADSDPPIPSEKPRAASRVRPTIPIPLEKPAIASEGTPRSVPPSTPGPPQPHIKMLTVVSGGGTNTLGLQDAKQQKNSSAITVAPAPDESASQTSDQFAKPARAAATPWPDPPHRLWRHIALLQLRLLAQLNRRQRTQFTIQTLGPPMLGMPLLTLHQPIAPVQ